MTICRLPFPRGVFIEIGDGKAGFMTPHSSALASKP
jgi:hypothetical protein